MFRPRTSLFVLLVLIVGGARTGWAQPGATNPPGTGPYSVQFFVGNTQYTYLTVNLSTTYLSGAAIPSFCVSRANSR